MRKIFPYLLLNIAVSAVTVLAVLMIWEANHKLPQPQGEGDLSILENQALPTATLPPMDEKTIEIQVVVGPGDIKNETVQLISVSQSPVNLLGWELIDDDKNSYFFPSVTIFPGGGINLFTRGGVDTAIELFWNQPEPIFSSGELIRLRDAAGNKRAEFRVP